MTYNEYKEQTTKELNEFTEKNCIWAFSDEQLKEALQEKNITRDDFDKNYTGFIGGGAIRKDKVKEFNEMCERHNNKLKELMQDFKFAYDSIYYELANHEYGYTYDETDALASLGLSISDIVNNPTLNKAFCKAATEIKNSQY